MSLTGLSTVAVRKPDPSLIDSSGTCPSDPEGQVVGYVHSVETGGTVDGPGIRYVVFLSGCPLHCQYCHNPDTRHMSDGKPMTAAALCADIATYAPFLKRARGGVTLSGGDPLTQAAFARAVLKGCKDLGLHTVLDTSGYLGSHADEELLAATDLVLLDIKSGDPETYRKVTGVKLQPTLEFALHLAEIGKPVWIRFVLVPGLTDAPENIEAVADIVATLPNVERIDILPFHKMGEYKWAEMRYSYTLALTPPASEEDLEKARQIFAAKGLKAN